MKITMGFRRLAAALLLAAFAEQPIAALAAGTQISGDPSAGHQQPFITSTTNNVPIVNITAPNGKGVSVNKFTSLNVGANGLIFNNSATPVATHLAGTIPGNQFLGMVPAQLILNEVTSGNPSSFLGYLEIAGQQANLVIANPTGITCSGCGFINVGHLTLTTGLPSFDSSGGLSGFNVTNGSITIGPGGLDASLATDLNLSARSFSINGDVYAPTVTAFAGSNYINANGTYGNTIASTSPSPTYAIDVAALGGMYANSIYLIATDAGVGVRSAGTLAAQTGDVTISSNGMLTLGGQTQALGNVTTTSAGDTNVTGVVYAQQHATITAQGSVTNTGLVAAASDVDIRGSSLSGNGTYAAGLRSNGTIGTSGNLNLTSAGVLAANGQNVAGGALNASGSSIDLSQSQTSAGSGIVLATSGNVNTSNATIAAGTTLAVSGANVTNIGGALVAGTSASITTPGAFDNTSGIVQASSALGISANSITNSGSIAGNSTVTLTTQALTNAGSITSVDALGISASASLANSGTIAAAGSLGISSPSVSNDGGTLSAPSLSLETAALTNAGGSIVQSGTGPANIAVSGMLDNSNGSIASNSTNLSLTPQTLVNNAGSIVHAGNGTLTVSASTIDDTSGSIATNGSANVTAGVSLTNTNGTIAANQIAITTPTLTNTGGLIAQSGSGATTLAVSGQLDNTGGTISTAATDFTLSPQTFINNGGTIAHAGSGTLTITTPGALPNAAGTIETNGTLSLTAASVDNSGGTVDAGLLNLQAGSFTNIGGTLIQTGAMSPTWNMSGAFDNTNGTISVGATDWTFAPTTLVNQNGHIDHTGAGTFTLSTGSLDNSFGVITQFGSGPSTFTVLGALDNTNGILQSVSQDFTITSGSLINTGGTITHAGTGTLTLASTGAFSNTGSVATNGSLTLDAASVSNAGQISATGTLDANVMGMLDNSAGVLQSGLGMHLTSGAFTNGNGTVASLSADGLSITAGTVDNRAGGTIAGNGAVTITTTSGTNNGAISALSSLALNGVSFDNSGGSLLGAGVSTALTGLLKNDGGQIHSAGSATLDAGTLQNGSGTIEAATALGITTNAFANAGTIGGDGAVTIAVGMPTVVGSATNSGTISSLGNLAFTTTGALDNTNGTLASGANASVGVGATLANAGGHISSAGTTSVTANTLVNSSGFIDGTTVALSGGSFANASGVVSQTGTADTTLSFTGLFDNTNGVVSTNGTNLNLAANSIANASGKLWSAGTGTFTIQSAGDIGNTNGIIATTGNLSISGASLTGAGSQVAGGGSTTVALTGAYDNTSGLLQSGTTLNVSAGSFTNTGGKTLSLSTDGLTLAAGTLTNGAAGEIAGNGDVGITTNAGSNAGLISSVGALTLNGGSYDNGAGNLVSGTTLATNLSGALANESGTIASGSSMTLNAGTVTNAGTIQSTTGLGVTAASLVNSGQIGSLSTDGLTLTMTGALTNSGSIAGEGNITLTAGALANSNSVAAAGTLTANATSFDNTAGTVSANVLDLSLGSLTNQGGKIEQSGTGATQIAVTGALNNGNGTIATNAANLSLNPTTFINGAGGVVELVGTGTLGIATSGALQNGGTLVSNGALTLSGSSVTNAGSVQAAGTASVGGGSFSNSGSVSGTDVAINVGGPVTNTNAIVAANGLTITTPGAFSNVGGVAQSGTTLNVSAASIDNTNGHLQNLGTGSTNIAATSSLVNNGGVLGGAGDVTVRAATVSNQSSGHITSGGNLALNVGQSFDNTSGNVYAAGTLSFIQSSTSLTNANGFLGSHGNATLSIASLANGSGTVGSDGDVTLTSNALSGSGTLTAGHDLDVTLAGSLTLSGQNGFNAANELTLNLGGTLTNTGTFSAPETLTINAASVNNSGSLLAGSALSLGTTGDITNTGTIQSSAVGLSSTNLSNTGSILGDTLTITASGTISNVGSGPSTVTAPSGPAMIDYDTQMHQLLAAQTSVWSAYILGGITNDAAAVDVDAILAQDGGWTAGELSNIRQWMDSFNPNFREQWDNGASNFIAGGYLQAMNAVQLAAAEANAGLPLNEVNTLYTLPQPYIQVGGNPTTTAQTIYNHIAALGTWSANDLAALSKGLQNCIDYGLPNDGDQVSDIVTAWVGYMNTALAQEYLAAAQPASTITTPAPINQNSGTIASTQSLTINAGTINNTNNGLIYSLGNMGLTASTIVNSSSTIQAQGNLTINAGTVTNQISDYTLGTNLLSITSPLRVPNPTTTIVLGQYITASTGAAQILSGNDMTMDATVLNNASTIAAGNQLFDNVGTYNELIDAPNKQIVWNDATNSTTTTYMNPTGGLGPVFTGVTSISGTIGTIQPVLVTPPTTGVSGSGLASAGSGAGGGASTVRSTLNHFGSTLNASQGSGVSATGPTATSGPSASGTGTVSTQIVGRSSETVALSGNTGGGAGTGAVSVAPSTAAQANGVLVGGTGTVAGKPNLNLPTSGLYKINSSGHTLITTIGPFANSGPSSAEIISAVDPAYSGMLLGDAFYEQQLVQQQVTQLTGMMYLPGYSSTQQEYAALLAAGVQDASAFNLEVGEALSPTQMAELTSDMVWLVNEQVDGQTVLVPVVYLANGEGSTLQSDGALIAAGTINLQTNNLDNIGTIASTYATQIVSAGNITNSGTITSLGNTTLIAAGNIVDTGTISAGNNLGLEAGGEIDVDPTIAMTGQSAIGFTPSQSVTGQGTLSAGGNLTVLTPGNINLVAANVQAGGDLTLSGASVNASAAKNISYISLDSPGATGSSYNEQVVQTTISAGGDVSIGATAGDVNLQATNVSAGGALEIAAVGNVAISNTTQTNDWTVTSTSHTSGFLSTTTTTTSTTNDSTSVVGSTLSGNTVTIAAGQNLSVTGSNIVGTGDVSLAAGNNLSVTSAQSTSYQASSVSTTTSGLMGASSGIGFSIGTSKQSNASTDSSTTQVASNIGSLAGNLSLSAGAANTIIGSSLYAAQNLSVTGSTVNIGSSFNTDTFTQTSSSSFTGFSASISSPAIAAGEGAVASIQQAGSVQNAQLQDLLAIQAGTDVATASQALTAKNGGILAGGQVSLSFGTSSENSSSTTTTNMAVGSTLTGTDVAVIATGGDLDVTGSTISGTNIALQAAQNINLTAAQNTSTTQTTNSASSTSIGVSLAVGQQASAPSSNPKLNMGLPSVNFSTATSNSNSTGTSVQQVNTVVNGTGTVSLTSGANTTLSGAQVSGNSILANIAGDLDLTSLQDTSTYNANSSSAGLNLSYSGNVLSGSINTSSGKTNSNYASVIDQTGLFAGAGGFDITVAGNTNLTGAVIASTADPLLNALNTNTLTFSNIQNTANYSATESSFGLSLGPTGKATPTGFGNGGTSGNASGVTQSAISEGTVTLIGPSSLAGLSRDPNTANAGSIGQIFNETEVQQQLELGQLSGQIGMTAVGQLADSIVSKYQDKKLQQTAASAYLSALNDPNADQDTIAAFNAQYGLTDATPQAQQAFAQSLLDSSSTFVNDPQQQQLYSLFQEGGVGRAALHGIVGAISSSLMGDSALSGGLGATAGDLAGGAVQNAVKNATAGLPLAAQGALQTVLTNFASGLAGLIIGGAVGGTIGGDAGSDTALLGDEFNRQFDQKEQAVLAAIMASQTTSSSPSSMASALGYYLAACELVHCTVDSGMPIAQAQKVLNYEAQLQTYLAPYTEALQQTGLFKLNASDNNESPINIQQALATFGLPTTAAPNAGNPAASIASELGAGAIGKAVPFLEAPLSVLGLILDTAGSAGNITESQVLASGNGTAIAYIIQNQFGSNPSAALNALGFGQGVPNSQQLGSSGYGSLPSDFSLTIPSTTGDGQWGLANESAKDTPFAQYESFITGAPPNLAYWVNGVKFDGVDNGTLVDAKANYNNFVAPDGSFVSWWANSPSGGVAMVNQALNQLAAANGTPITWYAQTQQTATAIKNLLAKNGINIPVVFRPGP